jgi:outer membrane protein
MNKFKMLLIALAVVFTSSTAMAQKAGYISMDEVISLMPEVARIDSQLQRFQRDTLGSQYEYLLNEFQLKDSLLNGKDSIKNFPTAQVRAQARQDLTGMYMQLQNWQQYAQNAAQQRQSQLLQPIYTKVMNAIRTVAKEKGYAYVYDKSVFIVAPDGDDLLPAVATKLNLKLPQGAKGGLR